MNVMYIKYNSKTCESILKNEGSITKTIRSLNNLNINRENNNDNIIDIGEYKNNVAAKKDDEITNFFFSAVHKNYLRNRNK